MPRNPRVIVVGVAAGLIALAHAYVYHGDIVISWFVGVAAALLIAAGWLPHWDDMEP